MPNRLSRLAEQLWYRPRAPLWLLPASWLFGLLVRLRRLAYSRGWLASQDAGVPVIVVGNISAGGTGKTPCVAWLAGVLQEAGYRPGIVSRGYGGRVQRTPRLVSTTDQAAEVGDEPLLLHQLTALPVCVCTDRVLAARCLAAAGINIIIADDGLQHYRLQRAVEIALVDGERLFGNGRLLPAGPLREPLARLQQVDLVLQNGGTGLLPGATAVRLSITGLRPLTGSGPPQALSGLAGRKVKLLAGISNPQRVQATLATAGIESDLLPVADHGRLAEARLLAEPSVPLLMTGKDAVKYPGLRRAHCWVLETRLEVPDSVREKLLARLSSQRQQR